MITSPRACSRKKKIHRLFPQTAEWLAHIHSGVAEPETTVSAEETLRAEADALLGATMLRFPLGTLKHWPQIYGVSVQKAAPLWTGDATRITGACEFALDAKSHDFEDTVTLMLQSARSGNKVSGPAGTLFINAGAGSLTFEGFASLCASSTPLVYRVLSRRGISSSLDEVVFELPDDGLLRTIHSFRSQDEFPDSLTLGVQVRHETSLEEFQDSMLGLCILHCATISEARQRGAGVDVLMGAAVALGLRHSG